MPNVTENLERRPANRPTACGGTILWTSPTVESTGDRSVMMPKRRHTRAHNTAQAITAERRLNNDYAAQVIAERNKPPPF